MRDYINDVIKVGLPLVLVGLMAYCVGIIEVALLSRLSISLVGIFALATMSISVTMSGLMSLITANQATFAKLHAANSAERGMVFISSLLTTLGIVIVIFALFSALAYTLKKNNVFHDMSYIYEYIKIASFSIVVVPFLFATKGMLNGMGKTAVTLRISIVENAVRLIMIFFLIVVKNDLDEIVILRRFAYALVLGEISGLLYAAFFLFKNSKNFGLHAIQRSQIISKSKLYFHKTISLISFSALFNVCGAFSIFFFMTQINETGLTYLGVFKIILTAFAFHRLVLGGISQSNGICAARYFNNQKNPIRRVIRYAMLTQLISVFVSIVTLLLLRMVIDNHTGEQYFAHIVSLAFCAEGVGFVLYRVLIHCGFEKSISSIGVLCNLLFLLLFPLIFHGKSADLLAGFFLTNHIIIMLFYFFKFMQLCIIGASKNMPAGQN